MGAVSDEMGEAPVRGRCTPILMRLPETPGAAAVAGTSESPTKATSTKTRDRRPPSTRQPYQWSGGASCALMGSPYDVSYQGTFEFDDTTPEELWAAMRRVDLFPTWWPWIRDIELTGQALELGSQISFSIDPPIPYRMRVTVDVTESEHESYLEGTVGGDLHGSGSLRFEATVDGSVATTEWKVEVSNPAMRAVIRLARPLLLWAQRWAVEVSLRGFRRYLADRP